MKSKNLFINILSICFRALGKSLELIGTSLYHELLKRNTLEPMMEIINEARPELQLRLLRKWARTKTREATYIQVAVGVLSLSTLRLF